MQKQKIIDKVNYDNFAKIFSNSRKNMKWEEIEYFLKFLKQKEKSSILDVGCGNGRLLNFLDKSIKYLGIDNSNKLLLEAKKLHKTANFMVLDMLDIDKIEGTFDFIFFIASFHHLKNIQDRIETMEKAYNKLKKGGIIFMTNWSLKSNLNQEKYIKSKIENTTNEFGSDDFFIKIGKYNRFYHSFSLKELDYLLKKVGFNIIENREYDNERNFISIAKK